MLRRNNQKRRNRKLSKKTAKFKLCMMYARWKILERFDISTYVSNFSIIFVWNDFILIQTTQSRIYKKFNKIHYFKYIFHI